jgi:hypothetical protein
MTIPFTLRQLNRIKKVSGHLLQLIIDNRYPAGLFYTIDDDGHYIACDNTTGEAFVEDFPNENGAFLWLLNP